MIDLIYLTYNRLEFTKASLSAMIANTDWSQVKKVYAYDDGSIDGTREYVKSVEFPTDVEFIFSRMGGPVAVMNNYLRRSQQEIFAKVDNDTMLPPYWLGECLKIMVGHEELGLLGIEAFYPVVPGQAARCYVPAKHIGGIGLMRRRCFKTMPHPNGYFGFTQWQRQSKVIKGWINPSIPICLLDRMRMEPWASLSLEYIAKGWQRRWAQYDDSNASLWNWWKP